MDRIATAYVTPSGAVLGVLPLPGWARRAACRGLPVATFVTEGRGARARDALEVCASCPVASPCRDYAIAEDLDVGIFGGMTGKQRRALKRPVSAPRTPPHDDAPADVRPGRSV